MNDRILRLLAVGAMAVSLSAHAQLMSADNGAAATDRNGLMWANTVGIDLGWSSTGAAGTAQAWIASLNASDYGGYRDWTLATGNGSVGPNAMTNQLGELFYTDCGNSLSTPSVLNNPGKKCTALSALNRVVSDNIFFSSSKYAPLQGYWWVYETPISYQNLWNNDTVFVGRDGPLVGIGDALAVRRVTAAPEIDATSAASGLTLLLGGLLVLRGRRRALTTG
jgi:hypothetical protein